MSSARRRPERQQQQRSSSVVKGNVFGAAAAWASGLKETRASVGPPEPEWVVQWASPEIYDAVTRPRQAQAPVRECLRVGFPLRLGYGCGSTGLVLRLAHLKGGADLDEPDGGRRPRRRVVDRRVARAVGLADAAAVLVLGQVLVGPVAAVAAVGMALAGLVRRLFRPSGSSGGGGGGWVQPQQQPQQQWSAEECSSFVGVQAPSADAGGGGGWWHWTERADEFSAAGAALAVAVPLLRWRAPEVYRTLQCVGAAVPLAAGYARTAYEVATLKGKKRRRMRKKKKKRKQLSNNKQVEEDYDDEEEVDDGKDEVEGKWRLRHRWAARRLCPLLTDLREPAALGWLCDAADAASVVAVRGTWVATPPLVALAVASDLSWFTLSYPLPPARAHGSIGGGKASTSSSGNGKQQQVAAVTMVQVDEQLEGEEELLLLHLPSEAASELLDNKVHTYNPGLRALPRQVQLLQEQQPWTSNAASSSSSGSSLGGLALFLRACWLALVFLPLILLGPVLYLLSTLFLASQLRLLLWLILRFCLERAGAAFIKWGQWSATRADMFPPDLCAVLARLQDRAPEHSLRATRRAIRRHLERSVDELFVAFPARPCASGSIAQVYRARLRGESGDSSEAEEVAVKVRHPGVGRRIRLDYRIVSHLADAAQRVPALRWLDLRAGVDQFAHSLAAQTDLRVEAANLLRFRRNFSCAGGGGGGGGGSSSTTSAVAWPRLYPHLVSPGVIVESFEPGLPLHAYLHDTASSSASVKAHIAAVGVDAYLKMMLLDNFVHTDLHPGNMLARTTTATGTSKQVQLVLLDCGLAQALPPPVRRHFVSLVAAVGAGDPARATRHLLAFSAPAPQRCPAPDLLLADMRALFAAECDIRERPVDLDRVLVGVLRLCRKHRVTVDASYASLLVAVCVLVGFARALDPDMSIMDATVPCLFMYNLTGRVMGRIYG